MKIQYKHNQQKISYCTDGKKKKKIIMDKRKKREFCHKQERNCQHILCLSAVAVFSPNTPSDLESAGELSHSLEVSSVNSIAKEKPWDKAQFHLGRRRKERDSWNQPSDSPFDDSLKLGRTLWDDSEVTPRPPEIKYIVLFLEASDSIFSYSFYTFHVVAQ